LVRFYATEEENLRTQRLSMRKETTHYGQANREDSGPAEVLASVRESQADLARLVRAYGANPTAARASVRKALTSWLDDPGLRCVRTTSELDKLTLDERKKYLALWAEVTAVLARTGN
jgi:hypothetical protein